MPDDTTAKNARGRPTLLPLILILVIFLPLGYSVVSRVVPGAGEPTAVFLEMPDPQHEECVKDTEYMRFHHWELLRDVREEIVRYGNRGEISLKGCVNCHPNRERFCDACHNAASVRPDCYGCHYYP
jgi:hypothetical protein